jgi:hypothetical protein
MFFSGSMTTGSSYQMQGLRLVSSWMYGQYIGNHGCFVPTKGSSSTSKTCWPLTVVDFVDVIRLATGAQ